MSKPTVYLAGPVTGMSYQGATDWREWVISFLDFHGIRGISPLRGAKYLSRESYIADFYDGHIMSTQKAITTGSRHDAQQCDIVLANFLGATKPSLGTVMELGWADAARTPIITVIEEGNPHDHAMIREVSGYMTNNLHTAAEVAVSILGVRS